MEGRIATRALRWIFLPAPGLSQSFFCPVRRRKRWEWDSRLVSLQGHVVGFFC